MIRPAIVKATDFSMHHMDAIKQLGIESKLVEIDSIKNFEKQQLPLFPREK